MGGRGEKGGRMGELGRRQSRRCRPRRRWCCRRRRHRQLRAVIARSRATRPKPQAASKCESSMRTCTHARTYARTFARMHTCALRMLRVLCIHARMHARMHACTHTRQGLRPEDEGGSCERSKLWGTRARQRTGCRAWVCGGAACSAARPGLGRSGQPVVQAALSSCWHLCSVSKHGRRRECVGYAGRAARRRSVPEVAAVRGDDVVML